MVPRTLAAAIGEKQSGIVRILALLAVFFVSSADRTFALDQTSHITQYGHSVWRIQDGAFRGAPNAIVQTKDGYLWIGTDAGLVRFDGVRFVPWSPPSGERLLDPRVFSLPRSAGWQSMDRDGAKMKANSLADLVRMAAKLWPTRQAIHLA